MKAERSQFLDPPKLENIILIWQKGEHATALFYSREIKKGVK